MRILNISFLALCAVVSLALLFAECGPRNPSLSQLILGKWSIDKLAIEDEDDSPFINTQGWIKFHTDNTFDSEGEPQGVIDGEWQIDEENGVLSITVSQNLTEKTMWDVNIEKKKMEWSNNTTKVSLAMTKP